MMSDEQIVSDGIRLAMTIIPTLTKHRAEVVDFALAQSLAYLLAGYHPDAREGMLANHVLLTGQLVPRMDKEIYKHCQRPRDWPPATTLGPKRDQLRD